MSPAVEGCEKSRRSRSKTARRCSPTVERSINCPPLSAASGHDYFAVVPSSIPGTSGNFLFNLDAEPIAAKGLGERFCKTGKATESSSWGHVCRNCTNGKMFLKSIEQESAFLDLIQSNTEPAGQGTEKGRDGLEGTHRTGSGTHNTKYQEKEHGVTEHGLMIERSEAEQTQKRKQMCYLAWYSI